MNQKRKAVFVILFLCTALFTFTFVSAGDNPWGDLKKLHFYDSVKDESKAAEILESIDCRDMSPGNQDAFARQLIAFGDKYYSQGNYNSARVFYNKVLEFSPKYWYLYNKLEKVDRAKGSSIMGLKNVFSQFLLMMKDFQSSYMVVNHFFNMLFFAGIFVFFLFSIILFLKYFRLAGNDLFLEESGSFSIKKTLMVLPVLLWPLLMLAGWMIYPFLIAGFLWAYINQNERTTIKYFLVVVVVLSFLYSINLVLEKNAGTHRFKMIQQVYNGHLFERDDYGKFDNQLKTALANSYYKERQYDTALDILVSTGDSYRDHLKFVLIGNIYFKSENFSESINAYKEALRLGGTNDITLNNFTMALLKNSQEDVFKENAADYPQLNEMMKTVSTLKAPRLAPTGLMWKRLFNGSAEEFSFAGFISSLLGEFFKLPVLYYILLFIAYLYGINRLFHPIGGSTYCSKCTKIIKEASVHKSYKLCDECYQLFLIKDVIFLEAKILKEKELNKKFKKRYIIGLFFSILLPGLNLNNKERNRLFIFLALGFYFFLGFAVMGMVIFNNLYSAAPIILNIIGMLAFIFYFLVNLFSVLGDYDGF